MADSRARFVCRCCDGTLPNACSRLRVALCCGFLMLAEARASSVCPLPPRVTNYEKIGTVMIQQKDDIAGLLRLFDPQGSILELLQMFLILIFFKSFLYFIPATYVNLLKLKGKKEKNYLLLQEIAKHS